MSPFGMSDQVEYLLRLMEASRSPLAIVFAPVDPALLGDGTLFPKMVAQKRGNHLDKRGGGGSVTIFVGFGQLSETRITPSLSA